MVYQKMTSAVVCAVSCSSGKTGSNIGYRLKLRRNLTFVDYLGIDGAPVKSNKMTSIWSFPERNWLVILWSVVIN